MIIIDEQRNVEIIKLRNEDKLTLQEIGNKYNLTRERVRQICTGDIITHKIFLKKDLFKIQKRKNTKKQFSLKQKRMHNIFHCLKQRCNNPKHKDYKYYGGRGIKCLWKNYEEFFVDMEKTYFDNCSIDRINVNGDYCKENCKWIEKRLQPLNRRPFKEWVLKSSYWNR